MRYQNNGFSTLAQRRMDIAQGPDIVGDMFDYIEAYYRIHFTLQPGEMIGIQEVAVADDYVGPVLKPGD